MKRILIILLLLTALTAIHAEIEKRHEVKAE